MLKFIFFCTLALAGNSFSLKTAKVYDQIFHAKIENKLQEAAKTLNSITAQKVAIALKCAKKLNLEYKQILTIIDYSLPSNKKRLWVFDLKKNKLLFHTYVSHGLTSGALLANYFSNNYNSKTSSIGVYQTEKHYYGRDGLSLRLDGLDKGFNNNAFNRYIVMHGGWYVEEPFIQKYGRAGRSWGCPAVPNQLAKPIIETIKDKTLFIVYYPNDNWFYKSKFLNCENFVRLENLNPIEQAKLKAPTSKNILFVDLNQNNKWEESEPIIVVRATLYQSIFHIPAPLSRMLRRQINNEEYIALNNGEFKELIKNKLTKIRLSTNSENNIRLNTIKLPLKINNAEKSCQSLFCKNIFHHPEISLLKSKIISEDSLFTFVIPKLRMQRGYYITEMKILNLGNIKKIKLVTKQKPPSILNTHLAKHLFFANKKMDNYILEIDGKPPITIKPISRFIRWLGL